MIKDVNAEIVYNEKISKSYYKLGLRTGWTKFNSGQFIMLKIPDKSTYIRRPFSISRKIENDIIEILYKVVGKGTLGLSKIPSGEKVQVLGPLGNGFSVKDGVENLILVAGGFGVAPFVNLVQKYAKKNVKIKLFYGGRSLEDILYIDEFQEMGVEVTVTTDDGSLGEKGMLDKPLLKLDDKCLKNSQILCCGPSGLNDFVLRLSKEKSLSAQISYETYMGCGIGVCLGCVVKTKDGFKRACKDGPVFDVDELL